MTNPIKISTPRLLLKSITPSLIHQLFRDQSKEEIMAFFNAGEEEYAHLHSMHKKGMETHRISMYYFLLIEKQTTAVIGECGFHSWNITHRRAELFYNLKNDSDRRKGYMSEAVAEVINFGFHTLGLHRIAGLTASWNTASIRILERFNFTKEGTIREDYVVDDKNEDSECYSLLKWEWEKYRGKTAMQGSQ